MDPYAPRRCVRDKVVKLLTVVVTMSTLKNIMNELVVNGHARNKKRGRTGVMLEDDLLGHLDRRSFLSFSNLLAFTHLPISVSKCKKRRPNCPLNFGDSVKILYCLKQVNGTSPEPRSKPEMLTETVKSVRLTPNSPPFPGAVAASFKSAKNSGKVLKHTLLTEFSPSRSSFVSLRPSPLLVIRFSQRLWEAERAE